MAKSVRVGVRFGFGFGLWGGVGVRVGWGSGSRLDLKALASAATSRASLAGPCNRKQLLIRARIRVGL